MRRKIGSPQTLKYTLSNTEANLPTQRLAQMQARQFWIERAFQEAKSHCGMAAIEARYRKQQLPIPKPIGAVNLTKQN